MYHPIDEEDAKRPPRFRKRAIEMVRRMIQYDNLHETDSEDDAVESTEIHPWEVDSFGVSPPNHPHTPESAKKLASEARPFMRPLLSTERVTMTRLRLDVSCARAVPRSPRISAALSDVTSDLSVLPYMPLIPYPTITFPGAYGRIERGEHSFSFSGISGLNKVISCNN